MNNGSMVTQEEDKADLAFQFYEEILGAPSTRLAAINLETLNLPTLDRVDLSTHFTEAEVWAVISSLPPDKAPGPNGFLAKFLQSYWPIIRYDIIAF
jgi:hypothetical protein